MNPINSIVLKHTARAGEAIAAHGSFLGAESAKLLIIGHVREAVEEALREPPAKAVILPTHEGWWWEWFFIPGLTPRNNQWVARDVEQKSGVWMWWNNGEWHECAPGKWVAATQPAPPQAERRNER